MRLWLAVPALAVGAMVASAQVPAKKLPQFDVVSIKLDRSGEPRGIMQISPGGDRVIAVNAPMFRILQFVFEMQRNDLVVGAPEWMRTERWDIEAKVAPGDLAAFHALTLAQQKAMLEPVLMDRCKMLAKVVKKEVPVYALVVAKGGIKMHEVPPGEVPVVRDAKGNVLQDWDLEQKHGEARGRVVPMGALMYVLSGASLDRQVVDRTGLKGEYNFDLQWTPDEEIDAAQHADAGLGDGAGLSIFTAVEEQLGLRLEPSRALVDAIEIEHIERPTSD
jgi:uncharacterized protein (TIGR03435 family)